MAKSKFDGLVGREVEIFLTTPLFRFKFLLEGEEHQLIDNAIRITGTVTSENNAGVILQVSELSNQREKQSVLPFDTIFLPFAKVDFLICV